MTADKIRVFLLDDHELVRRGLRDFLSDEQDFEVVGEAGTAAEALEKLGAAAPNVAILDVRLPDGSGIEVCREIRSRWPDVLCLMLTSFADERARLDAILAGASGYALKETKTTDLVTQVRRLAAGESLLDAHETQRILTSLAEEENNDRLSKLSEQERRVLDLIGEGLSNREIATELHLAEQTVKNYVSRLLAKLGVARRTQAALLAARSPLDPSTGPD
jgi:two-component system, NarL family, response regulator DevR